MRFVVVLAIFLLLGPSQSAIASRVICPDTRLEPDTWVRKYFDWADVVFLGTVTSIRAPETAHEYVLDAKTTEAVGIVERTRKLESEYRQKNQELLQIATFEISKSWKGEMPTSIAMTNDGIPGIYGYHFETGRSYLIFGHMLEDGSYRVSTLCRNTLPAESAAIRVDILDELAAER